MERKRKTHGAEVIGMRGKKRRGKMSAQRRRTILLVLAALAAAGFLAFRGQIVDWFSGLTDRSAGPGPAAAEFRADEPSRGTAAAAPDSIPDYSGEDYIVLNNNVPNFTAYDIDTITGEHYSELDRLGRCGAAVAMLDETMLPTGERGEIGSVKPSGWQTAVYPELIEDRFLYHRCHLIAWSLTGQNDNEKNLITGTQYMNEVTMLPFEREVLWYLYRSDEHVLYRVTPLFRGSELVARGVEMEAWSVEDGGASVCFHVFVYNRQPGIEIDYRTGDSRVAK